MANNGKDSDLQFPMDTDTEPQYAVDTDSTVGNLPNDFFGNLPDSALLALPDNPLAVRLNQVSRSRRAYLAGPLSLRRLLRRHPKLNFQTCPPELLETFRSKVRSLERLTEILLGVGPLITAVGLELLALCAETSSTLATFHQEPETQESSTIAYSPRAQISSSSAPTPVTPIIPNVSSSLLTSAPNVPKESLPLPIRTRPIGSQRTRPKSHASSLIEIAQSRNSRRPLVRTSRTLNESFIRTKQVWIPPVAFNLPSNGPFAASLRNPLQPPEPLAVTQPITPTSTPQSELAPVNEDDMELEYLDNDYDMYLYE